MEILCIRREIFLVQIVYFLVVSVFQCPAGDKVQNLQEGNHGPVPGPCGSRLADTPELAHCNVSIF